MGGFRWLVNAGLLALPAGTTVGVLIGVDSHRYTTGQPPIFTSDGNDGLIGGTDGTGTGGTAPGLPPGGTVVVLNGTSIHTYCQKSLGITPASKGSRFTMNPNQWGYTKGTPGGMCMNITTFENNTYATPYTAPPMTVTWQYPPGPITQPVHAFPYMQIEKALPLALNTLKSVNLDFQWTYGVGNTAAESTNETAMLENETHANVAVDIFLDNDEDNAKNSSKAAYEVMIWFARFGTSTQPIGLPEGIVATEKIGATTFNLYTGENGLGQKVLTWLATKQTEKFEGDLTPLVLKLASVKTITFPSETLQMGHLGVGSEAFHAKENVTFSIPALSLNFESLDTKG